MCKTLEESFRVPVCWAEPAALNTARSAAILAPEGISSVLLVTHALHMRRARAEAGHAALVAWPAPVRAERISDSRPGDWILRFDHLTMNSFAPHAWAGLPAQRMGF